MASPREGKHSLLHRIRGTPRSLRRKLGLSSSDNSSESSQSVHGDVINHDHSSAVTSRGNCEEFNCRLLGERTVYTLKPEDCFQFALDLSSKCQEKSLDKITVKLEGKWVGISRQPPSPTLLKHKSKSVARFTPPSGSPRFMRKPGSLNSKPGSQSSHKPGSQNSHKPGSVSSSSRNSSESSCNISPPVTTIFDTPYYRRVTSLDDSNPMTSLDDSSLMTSSTSELNNNHGEDQNFFHFDQPRRRSNTFNGSLGGVWSKSESESLPLHDIAYCVTLPTRPRIFLLTTRGREALTCRALLFARREKARALKLALAESFQHSYNEWRARFQRRRSSQFSDLGSRRPSTPNSVFESGDEPIMTSELDEAMHREFSRRASCLANPDQLSVGSMEGVEGLSLNGYAEPYGVAG